MARLVLDRLLGRMRAVELAALRYAWRGWWARPEQLPPEGDWRSWGFLGGRRSGKTRAVSEAILELVQAGKLELLGFLAQNEERTRQVQVDGPSGFLAVSPPWFRAVWEGGAVRWPNGAKAIPFSPHEPGNIRGDGVQLVWATELQSWPNATREEAWWNASIMASTPPGLVVWDCTPKRRHPILRTLVKDAEENPGRHHVVRGAIEENRDNLAAGFVEDMRKALAGTQREREELDGASLDEAEGAYWKQADIDAHRRDMPTELARRILVVDPAISTRQGTDETGLSELGLGADRQVYVVWDGTGKHAWEDWGDLVLARYERGKCDCVVVERNRGGDAVAANLRARGQTLEREKSGRKLRVVVVAADAKTRHVPGTVYVKEVNARGSKAERAGPVASLYEQGRVSHVRSADLDMLEDLLTTWEPLPGRESPDRMDPLVHGVWELVDLARDVAARTDADMAALAAAQRELGGQRARTSGAVDVARLLGASGRGRAI